MTYRIRCADGLVITDDQWRFLSMGFSEPPTALTADGAGATGSGMHVTPEEFRELIRQQRAAAAKDTESREARESARAVVAAAQRETLASDVQTFRREVLRGRVNTVQANAARATVRAVQDQVRKGR